MGDLTKVTLVMPQNCLGIRLLKSMLKPEDLYLRNAFYCFYKSTNLSQCFSFWFKTSNSLKTAIFPQIIMT